MSLFLKILHDSSHPMHSMMMVLKLVAETLVVWLDCMSWRCNLLEQLAVNLIVFFFLNSCVALWNDLPGEVFGRTLNVFKSNINKFLLSG